MTYSSCPHVCVYTATTERAAIALMRCEQTQNVHQPALLSMCSHRTHVCYPIVFVPSPTKNNQIIHTMSSSCHYQLINFTQPLSPSLIISYLRTAVDYAPYTKYNSVYHTPGDHILGLGFSSPGVVYRGGVVYTVPLVITWAVFWDFRLFTTPGGIL